MLGFKIVIYLTFICAVKASIIINVFEDKDIREGDSSSLECNNRDCYAKCRERHYTGGWCVDGQCYCNNALLKGNTVQGCISATCNQLCRRSGHWGGDCENDRCKCSEFRKTLLSFLANRLKTAGKGATSDVRDCDLMKCDSMCRQMNNLGGFCVFGHCNCY